MLNHLTSAASSRIRAEYGFSMIEVLVAMVTGIVVVLALFAILDISLQQTSSLGDRIQSDQLGRTAMTHIVDELHSACIAPEFRPVQQGGNGSALLFIDGPSEAAVIPNAAVHRHKIEWNQGAGTLTDYSYPASGGSWPNFTFSETASPTGGTVIASNIAQNESEGQKIPIFRYYRYAAASSSSGQAALSTINPTALAVPLSLANAETVASVLVSFTTFPTDGSTAAGRSVALNNQVTLSMNAPAAEKPVEAFPCQ